MNEQTNTAPPAPPGPPAPTGSELSDAEKQRQMIEWLETLLAYARGERKWDTSGPWVDEDHQLMPFQMGYWFDTETIGPGMPPYTPNAEVSEVAVADSTKTSGVRPPLSLD